MEKEKTAEAKEERVDPTFDRKELPFDDKKYETKERERCREKEREDATGERC